ncbi:MAG: molybdate ABC transporter substrate-binding protein, partial [Planctomycetaceae bacterium]|nr:molybdate ABC transporter substrate-binding protein [Planctomycetaceae bacterium]
MLRFLNTALLLTSLLTSFVLVGCAQKPADETSSSTHDVTPDGDRRVRVAAASDLKFAFDEVIRQFEDEHAGIPIEVTYGSSGNFYAQLSNEAPFDIYFSADMSYPRRLVEQGLADPDSELLYAIGHIVVWAPRSSPIDVEKLGMRALLDPAARKVAIANPQHAPYGR